MEETTPEFGQSVASVMGCLERSVEKNQCLIVLLISDYLRKLEMKGRELVEVKATSRTSIVSHMSIAVVYLESDCEGASESSGVSQAGAG